MRREILAVDAQVPIIALETRSMYRDRNFVLWTLGAGAQIDAARAALRKGEGIAIAELLAVSLDTFYGEKRSLFYASSWLAVHYLREGGDDGRTERFRRLFLYLAEGYPAETAFEATYGPLASADPGFRDYVKGL